MERPVQMACLWGKTQQEQPPNVTVTKHRELCHSVSAGSGMGDHLPGRGGGSSLALNDWCKVRKAPGVVPAAIQATFLA